MATQAVAPDFAILERLVAPLGAGLSTEAAQALVDLRFDRSDVQRTKVLAARAREETPTASEQSGLAAYERIGRLLALLHARASRALRQRGMAASTRSAGRPVRGFASVLAASTALIGRATVEVLAMNLDYRTTLRQVLLDGGLYPDEMEGAP